MGLRFLNAAALTPAALPKTYGELVARQVPRPIHERTTYDDAVEIVHSLAGFILNRDRDDYLQLMAQLVEDYERETLSEPAPVAGIETLRFLLAENDLTAAHIKKLSARFAVSADLLLV